MNDTTWSEVEQSGGYARIFAIERLRLYRVNHCISGLVEEASRLPQAKVGNTGSGGEEEEGMTSGDGGGGESFTS